MVRSRSGSVALALLLVLAGSVPARSGPLDEVQARMASGDRGTARETLDSLLAEPGVLEGTALVEAEFLRTMLEVGGAEYERRLRLLLEQELPPAREAWVHLSLGQIAFQRGDLAFALTEFQRARELGKEDEGAVWEGLTASALGDAEAARRALDAVKDASRPQIRNRARIVLGDTYRAGADWNGARAHYREVREEGPEGSAWWSVAAWREAECLLELGEEEEARSLLRRLITEVPASYETPLARARLAVLTETGGGGSPATEGAGPVGEGFAVQVGAFGSESNAEALAADLRERGLEAVRIETGEDGLFRVLLGRFPGREEAESYGDSLSASLGLGFSIVIEN